MPVHEYQYLVAESKNSPHAGKVGTRARPTRDVTNTVLLAIPIDTARKKLIVWSQINFHYYVFDTVAEYEAHFASTPAKDQCFYEVIFGDVAQRIKFDIDHATEEQLEKIVGLIKHAWRADSATLGNYESRKGAKFRLMQTGPTSYHVIIDHWVRDVAQMKNFLNEIIIADTSTNKAVSNMLDTKVYSRLQNFRILGCHKRDKEYVKKSIAGPLTVSESLVMKR